MKILKNVLFLIMILIVTTATTLVSYADSYTDEFGTECMNLITNGAKGLSNFNLVSIVGQSDSEKGDQIGIITETNFGELEGETLTLPASSVMLSTGTINKILEEEEELDNWGTPGDIDVFNTLNAHPKFSSDETNDAASIEFTFEADEETTAVEFSLIYLTSEDPGDIDYLDAAVVMADGVNYATFPNGLLLSNYNAEFLIQNTTGSFTNYYYISKVQKVTALLDPEQSTHTIKIAIADNNDHVVQSAVLVSAVNGSGSSQGGIVEEPDKYTVTFEVDGGSSIETQSIETGQKAVRPTNDPTKDGYTFEGWYADAECKTLYDFNSEVTSETTIYAKWRVRSHHKKKTKPSLQPKDANIAVIINGNEVRKGNLEENLKEVIKNKETSEENIVEISIVDEKSNDVENAVTDAKPDTAKATLKGDVVKILEDKEFELSVKREDIQYNIPAKDLTIESVAETLGVSKDKLKDVEVEIQITKISKDVTKKYEEYVKANKQELVIPPIEFNVVAKTTKADGEVKKVNINKFKDYAERVVEIPEGVEPSKITTGVVFNKDGSYSHIPTNVFQKNNKWYAKLNSLTNSDYSVIWNPVTVSSVENHWSQKSVNDMAARLVIEDVDEFNPNKSITRGEFATYIVKALGLYRNDYNVSNAKQFKDVSKMNDAINIASERGLIKGYNDSTFKPEAIITREEAMIIVSRAMAIADLSEKNNGKIENFKDRNQLKAWSYDSAKKTISVGLFTGNGNNKLNPRQSLTYAEAVTVIRNLLITAQLINE